MLTGKQKAFLRSMAHSLNPVFQIGKDGINENMLNDVLSYLKKHELMKISILNNSLLEKDEASSIFEEAKIEVVQIIGNIIVLYKANYAKEDRIKLPVKKF